MKQRSGFVSNSSSSSFIVFEDLSSKGIPCLKLNDEQMKRIDGFQYFEDYPAIHFEGRQGYLTKFITGYYDAENNILESIERHHYADGDSDGTSYDCDCYNEHQIGNNLFYILKDHDSAEQMTISQFAAKIKREYGNIEVLVQNEREGIFLKILK